jgi:hypothetical protein
MKTLRPSSSHVQFASQHQQEPMNTRSPTLQQQEQHAQQKLVLAAELEKRMLLDKELADRAAELPAINTRTRSAPPGFGRPTLRDVQSGQVSPVVTPRTAHTPVFQQFQPPAIRRGWEGFCRTYEQEMRNQFLKSITKGPRMDFPRFDGDNPGGWIRQCNKYFQMAGVPEDYKTSLSQLYIIGRADVWLRRSKLLNKRLGWPEFCEEILNRFSPCGSYDLTERFNTFKQNQLTVARESAQTSFGAVSSS